MAKVRTETGALVTLTANQAVRLQAKNLSRPPTDEEVEGLVDRPLSTAEWNQIEAAREAARMRAFAPERLQMA